MSSLKKVFKLQIVISFLIFLVSCEGQLNDNLPDQSSDNTDVSETLPPIEDSDPIDQDEPSSPPSQELSICSKLSFDEVDWPEVLNWQERNSLALALNISGSFEGHSGWNNLSNNFDGQGVSMGLLNQNFGQGSLQVLFIKMKERYPKVMEELFQPTLLQSMYKMLKDWEAKSVSQFSENKNSFEVIDDLMNDKNLNLNWGNDIDKYYADFSVNTFVNSRNKKSVDWSLKNFYVDSAGRNFKTHIKQALKDLANSPQYISLQIEAALKLHDKAKAYMSLFNFSELRSYLFFFDIIVQNGSIKNSHRDQYFNYLKNNPNDSITENLLNLLEIRLVSTIPRWREDVRKRKRTIILSSGTVHGSFRNLPQEYCYNPGDENLDIIHD